MYKTHSTSPLYSVIWYRIMLDEAHIIRNRLTEQAKCCYELSSIHRWCLTGTPIQNSLNDVYSLLHYLNESPWADYGMYIYNRMMFVNNTKAVCIKECLANLFQLPVYIIVYYRLVESCYS